MTPSVARFMRGLYRASHEPVPSALESLLTLRCATSRGLIVAAASRDLLREKHFRRSFL